jgi:hypothetical protein
MRVAALTLGALITVMVAAPAVAQTESPHRLSVGETNAKVLVQRGQDFLPAMRDMSLEQRDKIVVLEGGDATVFCDGEQAGRYNETGIYPAPQCGPVVAAAAPATAAPVATSPAVPVAVVGSGTNWGAVAAITGGIALIALASTIGSDSPRPPPVSP